MIKSELIELRDHIAGLNPYFDNGFDYCVKDSNAGAILAFTEKGKKFIFPEDRLGNYFFLLVDDTIKFSNTQNLSDTGIGKRNQIDNIPYSLVAIVNDADEIKLLANLRNTISSFKSRATIVANSANIIRESVVLSLMRGFQKEEILNALTGLKKQTIIELKMTLTLPFIPNNCITDVCRNCD